MGKTMKRYFPIFVLPTLIAFFVAFVIPFIMGVYLSFCDFTTVTNAKFVGLENYIKKIHQNLCAESCIYFPDSASYNHYRFSL